MMTLVLAFMGVARADVVTIGSGNETNSYVPTYGFYNYSLTQQLYTAAEIGGAGTIYSIAYFNAGTALSRTVDLYMVNTTKTAFTSGSDWVPVTAADKVFSGSVTFTSGAWTTITLDTPFEFDGSNLAIMMDDNTGSNQYGMSFRAFDGGDNIAALYVYNDYTNYNPLSPGSGNTLTNGDKNQIQLDFTPTGGVTPVEYDDLLHVKYTDPVNGEIIDSLNLGTRPINAWMAPFEFVMFSEGPTYTVNVLDFTPSDGIFNMVDVEYPYQVAPSADVDLLMSTNGTQAGIIERQFVAITEGDRAAHIWPVVVEFYAPEVPDVVELPCEEATSFPFVEVPATAHNTVLHNDYTLPFPEIPEGYDAVYKLVFDNDMILNAEVTQGENGKVALYQQQGNELPHPMADNNYTGLGAGGNGGGAGASFEVQIGEGTNTTGYFPFYTLYNYSIAENLFLATELTEAGVTTAPMTSLSWYATNETGYSQQGITIWMANVPDTELTTTSHVVTGMTKVYTGAMTPAVGWNEFVFNEGSFSWDGHSNVLIYCQRNNGSWNSTVNWQATNSMNFNCMAYNYQDSGAYNETVGNTVYTSTTRPNIIMKGGNREVNRDVILSEGFENGFSGWTMTNCHGSSGVTTSYYAHSGSASFRFYYTTNPPQYLITPMLTGTENGGEVSFWYTGYSNTYTERFQVGYSSTTNDVDAFTFGPEISCTVDGVWTEFTDSFPAGTKYIAVKHTAYDQFYLFVDDFTVTATPGSTPTPGPTPTPGTGEDLDISAGPVISNLPLTPGTYYLVASSTDEDFEVTINAEPMPCPAIDAEGFAFNPQPADDEDELEPASVTLRWMVPEYATGWRLVFGSTYYPDPNHDQTIIYPEDGGWSTTMANSYTVHNLWNNTNYFWHVEFNNGACPEGVSSPIWGFTTHLNVPQNLTVEDETVFNDEQIVLNWNPVVDRTYRYYFIYRDGVKIGETQVNNIGATTYTDGPLAYNMNGYNYYVTAIYDEGESAPSNTVNVKVSGYGDVNGHVFEQDGTTGIANATVLMVGEDEFGDPHTYNFTTDGNGYYSGHIYAGEYDGQAACNGYQPIDAPVQGNPIAINYNETTSPIDYVLDENFYGPCAVVAEYYPDSLDPNSPYVKVYWGCGLPTGGIVEDFETGDFSKIDWQLDGSYPWTITTTSPYEGTYCMKSGGAGVANVVSNMTVTVNVPADGQMSFYGKISCENNWDYGYFYIDGVQRGSYSGTSSWVERIFDITEGEHTFQWRYTKDGSVNSNDDCFYVDYISFLRQPDAAAAGMNIDAENSNEQGFSTDDRALSHYRVYRTNCYNDGPYTEENTVLLATVWVPDTVYIDVEWADLAPGVYKWGVGAVYVGNRGEEVESPVAWTAPMDVNLDKANRQTITIGDGTSTTYYGPFNSLWGYSFVEQIYTAGEIGTAGPITAIGFNMESTDPETNQVDIFMKNVSRSSFADNADWEPVSNTDKVFSGTVTFENGWTTITLDTPFQYDGTSNLMIGMHEYTPGYSTRYFYYTNASNALISAHSDTADPDPFNIGAFTGTKYVQSYRPNLQLEINGSGVIPGSGENPYGPGTDPIQEERESVIVWSNCLDKDMYMENVDVTVLLNSADSPEGTVVTLTNLNDVEQDLYPVDPVTLDGSGYYAWDTFRRGNYAVQVELDGYETIYDTVNIWEPAHLRYVMIEILYKVGNIYVSRTGWAMWDGIDISGGDTPAPVPGDGDTFSVDFEAGLPTGWTVNDANNDGWTWCLTSAIPTTWTYYSSLSLDWYHSGSNAICSGSYINGVGALTPNEYLISPATNIASGSQLSFWVAATDASYPADHFGVFVSTTGTNPDDFESVQEWTLTAKKSGMVGGAASRDGRGLRLGTWYNYTVDLSAYAGNARYIAFRHFNCYDQYIMVLDDIQLTSGAKSDDRHLEYYKVMCTSIDGVPIFNHNTVHPFCQLSTDEPYNAPLVEGEHYLCKVACMYSSGWSDWSEPVEWVYEPCDHWGPVDEVTVNTATNGNHIEWVFEHGFNPYGSDDPGVVPPGEGDSFSVDFEGGMPAGWTVNDANNDGWTWCLTSAIPTTWTYYASLSLDWYHSGSNAICSGSYINGVGALTPNEYLISPATNIANGAQLSFWVAATDASYPADHFGVFVSTTGTNPSDFESVQEWTLTAKKSGMVGGAASRDGRGLRLGTWYNYTVDLSAYAGNARYIAFRHFNCTDQYIMVLDDITLSTGAKSYNAMASGMLNNGSYAFNITDIANYDERVYFLYNLVNDNRFDVINGEANGMFIISATSASLDLEEAVNDFVYNNNIEFGLMDKVQAADVANAYKSSLPSGFVNSLMMDMYIQSRENNMCEFADPFCTDNGMYEFPAGVNAGSGETGPDYDCLYTQPNPAWYYMRIGDAGAMDIHMYSTPQVDIDFCCWGPFDDPTSPCPYGLTEDKVVSCSYSTSWTEHCLIPATAQTGEYYILVITNYSNQTCNINFSMVEGNGSTDCGILPPTDIIGFLITQDGEYLAFAGPTEREYTDIDEFGDHTYCVRPIYPGEMNLPDHNYGWSMGCPVCADNNGEITCEPGWPIHAEEMGATDQVKIWWGEENPGPGPGGCEGDEFSVNFESGMPAGWTTIDADGDGNNWTLGSVAMDTGYGHNGSSDMILSKSYDNNTGALYPDNYLVSPEVTLCEGSVFSFWACAQDAGWAAEHFGVFVSDNGTSNWTMVQEWTMTAKGQRYDGPRGTRDQGNWYQYTVDLSSYAGEGRFVAIRHFNSTDMFYLDVDDIELSNGAKSNRAAIDYFNVYRSTDNANYSVIGTVAYDAAATYYEYIDTPEAAGTYYYQVKAVYDNGCVSEAAAAFDNPAQNYVQAEVTGMGENNDNVALYPNPTSGNVTIEANGMSRITVVSVLGQVVYDAEVNADNVTLNMSQFNAGMYMVRVYTEEGVVVKRVTVMQ